MPHGPAVAWSVSRRDTFCQSFAKLTLYALNEALIRGWSASVAVSRHQNRGPTASAEKTADPSPRSTATAVRTTLSHMHTRLLTAIFQASLGKPVASSVVVTGRWGCHKVLQPVLHPLISTTMAKGFWCKVFKGRMPFLFSNQQHYSAEGK